MTTTTTVTPGPTTPRPARRSPHPAHGPRIPGSRGAGFWLYLLPGLVLITAIIVVPLVWNVYLSFTAWNGVGTPEWVGTENWERLLQDAKFWTSFRNSIVLLLAMVVVPTLTGLVLAAVLFDVIARRFSTRLSSGLRALYYLPQIMPIAITGIVMGWILRPHDGALNLILRQIGLGDLAHDWLGKSDTAMWAVMAVLVWIQIGYPVVVFMAALQRVDPELYEAAELDGAGWFRRFQAITVSAIRPEIFVVTLTCTIATLKVFGPVYILTGGGPGTSTIVPAYYAYVEFFTASRVGYGAAIATALTVVVAVVSIVFVVFQRRLEDKAEA